MWHLKRIREQMDGHYPHYNKGRTFLEEMKNLYLCQSSEERGRLELIYLLIIL
jgi:hypothetical protein